MHTTHVPASAGIGLKARHVGALLEALPRLSFLEIHAENYMGAGGPPHRDLARLAEHYPISVHGVGLSLGTARLDLDHLERLARVVERVRPALVSEHLAWAQVDGVWLNDLLPIPYNARTLTDFARNVERTQVRLGRAILVENPSAYVAWTGSTMDEPDFLAELVRRTGCSILLDVNNLYVSARNLGFDPEAYLDALPRAIGQYHLAGHHVSRLDDGSELRIDDHGSKVIDPVWDLYRAAIARFGPRPTLIEWDTDVPPLDVLLDQAARADAAAAEGGQAHAVDA